MWPNVSFLFSVIYLIDSIASISVITNYKKSSITLYDHAASYRTVGHPNDCIDLSPLFAVSVFTSISIWRMTSLNIQFCQQNTQIQTAKHPKIVKTNNDMQSKRRCNSIFFMWIVSRLASAYFSPRVSLSPSLPQSYSKKSPMQLFNVRRFGRT